MNIANVLFRSFVLAIVGVLLFTQGVFALSAEQKRLYDLNVLQFDIVTSPGQCSETDQALALKGNSNGAKAFNYLVGQGLTDYQAAGVIGNLIEESGIIPNRKQGEGIQTIKSFSEVTPGIGYGIAQWTTADRQDDWGKLATQKGMNPLSLELELMYLWQEFETNAGFGLDQLLKAPDLRQAAWVFLVYFERPLATRGFEENPIQATSGTAKAELDKRVKNAEGVTGGSGSASSAATQSVSDPALEPCDNDSSTTGDVISADGYTFPLVISKEKLLGNDPPWCAANKNNCHHDYNAADIMAPTGTPVVAMRGGTVESSKDNADDPSRVGSRVDIRGDDGWLYYYAHMGDNTLVVKKGQTIEAGEPIGKIGTSANAVGTAPHLHIDRLPAKEFPYRVECSGSACSGYPFDNIQPLLSKIFESAK